MQNNLMVGNTSQAFVYLFFYCRNLTHDKVSGHLGENSPRIISNPIRYPLYRNDQRVGIQYADIDQFLRLFVYQMHADIGKRFR